MMPLPSCCPQPSRTRPASPLGRSRARVTAAIYVLFAFLVSQSGKMLADWLRRRYGLAAA